MATKPAAIALLALFLIGGHAQAQNPSDRGTSQSIVNRETLSEAVTDQAGAVLPDVTVTLLDADDAMAAYQFGPSRKEQKLFKVSVNVQNVGNRKYFEAGNTPTVIFPGSPVNVLSRLEVRF